MKHEIIKRTHKRIELSFIFASLFTLIILLFFLNGIPKFEHTGDNTFYLYLNGEAVGVVDDEASAEHLLIESRRAIASKSSSLMFMTGDLYVRGEERLFGKVDSDAKVMEAMEKILSKNVDQNVQRTCTVKIEDYMITLRSLDDARRVLQAALDLYDDSGRFQL